MDQLRFLRMFSLLSMLVVGACNCTDGGGEGDPDASGRSDAGDGAVPFDSGVHDVCGDSVRGITEQCDDGDADAGDGCSDTCNIESGYRCPIEGSNCVAIVCNDLPPKIEAPETCEDGNTASGDGCSSSCMLEPGYRCPLVGAHCVAAECGDGIRADLEGCDDGDTTSGDGCSSTCRIELGYDCPGAGTTCAPTVCGDATLDVTEQCLDDDALPFDGCDENCQIEPSCNAGVCTSVCGDGVAIPGQVPAEACEDGNTLAGDGCSPSCAIEPEFDCTFTDLPDPDSITISVLYRDFIGYSDEFAANTTNQTGHLDFNNPSDSNDEIEFDVVDDVLGTVMGDDGVSRRVPILSGSANSTFVQDSNESPPHSATSFSDWYVPRSYSGGGDLRYNRAVVRDLTLTRLTTGPNAGSYQYDSMPTGGFFPLDDVGYDVAGSNPREIHTDPDGGTHNFSFTTEAHFVFRYTGTERLDFAGDDDLWVFIDGQLCLDVGGLHPARSAIMDFGNINNEGNATQRAVVTACKSVLDARANAANGPANDIPVYFEMIIFHAERHRGASNFKLTLKNFLQRRSVCTPKCGDGVVTRFEVCDNGTANNNGGYNECNATCDGYGGYCGDGVVEGPEACDDGVNSGGYGMCAPGCVAGPRCGDSIRQGTEQCDDGASNGDADSQCDVGCIFKVE